ncbi:hypothetical protein C2E23DRAFT_891145 [Lenzites betulinus]|nr:hypothetical protein C2E23DRAFT_891145 [Lenzites betulinus]
MALPGRPAPPSSLFATYFSPVLPTRPITVGLPVHLHLLCFQAHSLPARLPKDLDSVSIPIAVKGVIAGERARTATSVEFVVMNDLLDTGVRRAFITLDFHPRLTPLPDLASMIARSLPDENRGWRHSAAAPWPSLPIPDVTPDAPEAAAVGWMEETAVPRAGNATATCECHECARPMPQAFPAPTTAHPGITTLAPQTPLPAWGTAGTPNLMAAPDERAYPRPPARSETEWRGAMRNDENGWREEICQEPNCEQCSPRYESASMMYNDPSY